MMVDLIKWLISIEQMAYDFYSSLMKMDIGDNRLINLITQLAADEKIHKKVMESALEFITEERIDPEPQIIVDDQMRERLISPLKTFSSEFTKVTPDFEEIIKCIVKVEFSEWNHVFLYVLNTLKEYDQKFHSFSSQLEGHQQIIIDFLDERNLDKNDYPSFQKFPNIWDINILIIEQNMAIRSLLETIFCNQYSVTITDNGEDGLRLISESYYDVIITDIRMPKLDGLGMIKKIVPLKPQIGNRMLVYSSYVPKSVEEYLENLNIRYINKPGEISDIIASVEDILKGNNKEPKQIII